MSATVFPTLFAIAMDYLPIQASAVPCERVFSSSAETDTKKRNRISPLLMEALQMLKYRFKKDRLNFMEHWLLSEKDLTEDDPEEDILPKLLDDDYQDAMDQAMRSIADYEWFWMTLWSCLPNTVFFHEHHMYALPVIPLLQMSLKYAALTL